MKSKELEGHSSLPDTGAPPWPPGDISKACWDLGFGWLEPAVEGWGWGQRGVAPGTGDSSQGCIEGSYCVQGRHTKYYLSSQSVTFPGGRTCSKAQKCRVKGYSHVHLPNQNKPPSTNRHSQDLMSPLTTRVHQDHVSPLTIESTGTTCLLSLQELQPAP